jgi:hypothetical protein
MSASLQIIETGCVAVERSDHTFFSTIYDHNGKFSAVSGSGYARMVLNAQTRAECEFLTRFIIAKWNDGVEKGEL